MTQTISGAELIAQNPQLAASVFERNCVDHDQAKSLHFLFLQDFVANEDNAQAARVATTAIVFDKPVRANVVGVGVAVKSPDDIFDAQIGRNIAAARAVRRLT